MTVIAVRDGVMASDSLSTLGDQRFGSVRKICKSSDGYLAGSAGFSAACAKFLAWVESGCEKGALENVLYADFTGLLVDPKGHVYAVDGRGHPYRLKGPFVAIGSGSDYALGAMEMGASAEDAVRAAIKHSTTCGGKVVSVRIG